MGWVIGLAAVALLAFVPLQLRGEYDATGACAWFQIGPWRYFLYPSQRKSPMKRKSSASRKTTSAGASHGKRKSGGKLNGFLSIAEIIWDFIKDLHGKMRVELLELKVTIGDGDPADLAIKYGQACGAVAGFLPQLDRFFIIKKQDVDVSCDFESSETMVTAKLYISVTLGRLIFLLANHGMKFIRNDIKTKNQRKGGAKA